MVESGAFEGMKVELIDGAVHPFQRPVDELDLHALERTALDHAQELGRREARSVTNGDATGLKYLAGKTDCLTVKSGEGYCRK
jgi:hypothetical protein